MEITDNEKMILVPIPIVKNTVICMKFNSYIAFNGKSPLFHKPFLDHQRFRWRWLRQRFFDAFELQMFRKKIL